MTFPEWRRNMKTVICFLVIIFFSSLLWVTALAKDSKAVKAVAVLPFTTHDIVEKDSTRQAISHVFSSSLAEDNKIMLLFRDDVYNVLKEKEDADLSMDEIYILGRRMGADYIIYGTVNPVGYNLGISVELIDIRNYKRKIALSTVCHGIDEVIPKMKDYAHRIEDIIDNAP